MQDIKAKSIAVITGNCSINEESDAIKGICSAAKIAGWNVFIFDALNSSMQDYEPLLDTSIFSLLNYETVSGVIITQNIMNNKELGDSLVNKLRENGLPVISLGYKSSICHSYIYQNSDYIEKITDHVIEKHNCRTLNFVAGIKNNIFSDARIKAFKRSLKKHDILFEKKRLFYGEFWEGPTMAEMEKFLESGLSLPDAFICSNDVMAMAVISCLNNHGYSVPDDVIVTGYDGVEFERYSTPRLTTAKCNYVQLGELTFKSLLKLISGDRVPKIQSLNPEIIFSQSCGCQNRRNNHQLNLALKAMNSIGSLQYINMLSHKLATISAYSQDLESFRHTIAGKGFYNPNTWVLLNHDFDSPKSSKIYTSENPYSHFVDCFIVSENYEHYYDVPPIRHSEYIPDLKRIIQSGITNLVLMNLSFGGENIGYLVSSYDDTSRPLNSIEVFSNVLSQGLSSIKYRSKLEYMTVRDVLTGIYNRRGFFTEITSKVEELSASEDENKKQHLIIFSIDMDELKFINDTYGHKEGDWAIKKLAEVISIAGGPDSISSRFGGDEFVSAVISSEKPEKVILSFKEKLSVLLTELNHKSGKPYSINASVGAKSSSISAKTKIDKVIAKADEMMYSDKASKKRSHPR